MTCRNMDELRRLLSRLTDASLQVALDEVRRLVEQHKKLEARP